MLKHTKWISGILASSALAVVGGCGDGPICPSELVVVIQGPANGDDISSADDKNLVDAGTQVDVVVRSNFNLNDPFVLTVTDENDAVSQFDAVSDGSGNVTFVNVTLPRGAVTLSASGTSDCGTGSDTSEITVQTEADCALSILEGPIDNEFYAPIPVLNSSNDTEGSVPNFQANLQIETTPGFTVEAFVLDTGANVEASVGTATADENGVASFPTTLAQGRQAVRATCTSGGINEASATNTVHVDTIVPACTLSEPAIGVTVTPDDDTQGDISDGIQMVWTAAIDDAGEGDTEGESVSFFRDALEFPGTAVSSTGTTSTDGLAEFTAPGSFAVSMVTQDHAANSCTAGHDVAVILDGCAIAITSPTAVVTADSNANPGDGVQTDIGVTVGADCLGETVFVDCGSGELSATVAAGETTVADVTLNADPESAGTVNCTARVTNSENFQTSDTQPVTWDTEAPGTLLTVTAPAGLDCGESVVLSVGNDFNNDLSDGFQVQVQALASNEISIDIEIVNSAGTTDLLDVGENPLPVTLQLGTNAMQASATDAVGNVGVSTVCTVTVSDVIITIDDPAGSGVLSAADGTVNGANELELTVCGTVSIANTVNVSLTVGPDNYTATVTGNNWCTDTLVALAEGNHVFDVDAASTLDARVGNLSLPVAVDITPPDAPGTLSLTAPTRQEIDASWTASAGAANYILRFRTTAFTDFLNQGTEVAGVGSSLAATIFQLRPGQEYFVGVAAVDANGNISAPAFAASIVPQFDESPTFIPETSGDGNIKQYGAQIVGGDFDNDGFSDVAVSAPFEAAAVGSGRVYIYFGSATGTATVAGVVIEGVDALGPFGDAMTRISWNAIGVDDLAISSYQANSVYVYDSASIAAAKASGTPPAGPDLTITAGVGSWFASAFGATFGFGLSAGQIDGAGTEDLIIGVPFAGPGAFGGAAIVYGGTPSSTTVTLSELAGGEAGMAGLVGHYVENPNSAAAPFSSQGQFVAYLGDTRAGDAVGDFAMGAQAEFEIGDHRVYVVRGRTAPAANTPMQEITFGGNDLEIVLPASSGTTTAFGETFGSISGGGGTGLRNILISAGTSDSDRGALYLVDGGQTGTLTLTNSSNYLAKISGGIATSRFGGAVVNNALGNGADVDGDGLEDLVVAGGRGSALGVYIWYAGNLPTGDVSDTSRDYFIPRPDGFANSFDSGSKLPISASWVGDMNGDGLFDICWGDAKRFHPASEGGVDTNDEGMVVILSDDGV